MSLRVHTVALVDSSGRLLAIGGESEAGVLVKARADGRIAQARVYYRDGDVGTFDVGVRYTLWERVRRALALRPTLLTDKLLLSSVDVTVGDEIWLLTLPPRPPFCDRVMQ